MWRRICAAAFVFGTASTAGHDAEHSHTSSAHTHGTAELQIAVAGHGATATLRIAGMSAIGFERAPRSTEETQRLDDFRRKIARGDWLVWSAPADCRVIDSSVSVPGFDEQGSAANGQHAEFHATLNYRCTDGTLLSGVSVKLLDAAHSLDTVNVEWITPAAQGAATVDRRRERVDFAP